MTALDPGKSGRKWGFVYYLARKSSIADVLTVATGNLSIAILTGDSDCWTMPIFSELALMHHRHQLFTA